MLILTILLLVYNLLNESLLYKYKLLSSDKTFQFLWHVYDAGLRVILLGLYSFVQYGLTTKAIEVAIGYLLFYHVIFDIGFNYLVARNNHERITLVRLLYLGDNTLDNIIRNIGIFITKIHKKLNKPVTVPYTNLFIKVCELIIFIFLIK